MVVSCLELPNKRAGERRDVVGVSCLKDESGAVKVGVDDQKKIWKKHMEKLMNEWSNEWSDSDESAVRRMEVEEVRCAMNRMKIRKVRAIFKAAGDKCLKSLTNIFNKILFKDVTEGMDVEFVSSNF